MVFCMCSLMGVAAFQRPILFPLFAIFREANCSMNVFVSSVSKRRFNAGLTQFATTVWTSRRLSMLKTHPSQINCGHHAHALLWTSDILASSAISLLVM